MGTITLVRHGQANSAATDEAGYDRLSDLGHQQAKWLGEWLRGQNEQFDAVLSGNLRRHRETAAAMGFAAPVIDPRLNELDYFNLSAALRDTKGIPMPNGEGFLDHMPQVMEAWHRAEIMGHESFETFEARVAAVLDEASQPGRNVLCITSGGVIGMVMRHLLRLDPRQMAHILIPIRNSSIHRVHVTRVGNILAGFNATPHLDPPDRAHARTHY
jgi:broad specificity phosphatase PhoE